MAFGSSLLPGTSIARQFTARAALPAAPIVPPSGGGVAPPPPPPPNPYAGAQAAAQADIQQQIASLNALLASQQQAAQQRADQIYQASLAAAKFLGGLGAQTAGYWNQGANVVAGLGRGYGGMAGDAANAEAAKVQSQLNSAGSPATAVNHGADLAMLTTGLGGVMPARGLVAGGIAAGALADTYPANLINLGRTQAAGVLGTESQNELPITQKIAEILGTLPKVTQQYVATAQKQKTDAVKAKTAAINQWATVQRIKQGDQRVKQGAARLTQTQARDSFNQWATQQGLQIRWNNLSISEQKAARAAAGGSVKYQKGPGGTIFNPQTGQYVDPITRQPVVPPSGANAIGTLPKATAAEVGKAAKYVSSTNTKARAPGVWTNLQGQPITDAQIKAAVDAHNKTASKANQVGFDEVKNVGKGGDAATKAAVAASLGLLPPRDQVTAIYRQVLQQFPTLTPYQAFTVVAASYPPWGKANRQAWFPKGGAARGGIASNASLTTYDTNQYVQVASGANRPGVPLNPTVAGFVGKIGSIYGSPLTIGTGSNHHEYSRPGVVSDHWSGNAADIPASGDALTQIGRDALVAAGADPAWAAQQKGGLYNIGGWQIIFNIDLGPNGGGNHWNHLHVGYRGGRTSV